MREGVAVQQQKRRPLPAMNKMNPRATRIEIAFFKAFEHLVSFR
jgi:hypothetical protein